MKKIALSAAVLMFLSLAATGCSSDKNWSSANQDLSNTRSAVNSDINLSNISKLGPSWYLPIKGVSAWGAAATNPVIIGNTVYFQDLKSNVYAVDFKTGKQLWMKEYNLDNAGPNGVAVAKDKIFAVKGSYEIAALDLSGKELWSVNLSEQSKCWN